MSSKTEQAICITSCDRYLGNGIARVLLNDRKQRGQQYQVRVLARDISKLNEFKQLGAEVIQIDYSKVETIERALTGSLWVLWIPESDNDRLNLAKIFADACKKANVGNLLFASILGADDADEKSLREFREMEKKAESIVDRHCILRSALFVQCLHHFSKWIVEKNQLALPIRRESRMAPIHLNDVYCSIHRIICDENGQLRDMDKNHQKRHYALTGPESITANTLIEMMNIVTDARVEFLEVKRQECEEYLKSCEDKQMTRLTKLGNREENREDLFPTPPCPNDSEIETFCDVFDYIKSGKASYISGDVQKIIEREPIPVLWYFKNHSDEFKPKKPGKA